MATSGPNFPSTGTDLADATRAWSFASRITADDGSLTTCNVNGSPSNTIQATGFGFSIPTGSTINGITAEYKKKKSGSPSVLDSSVKLVQGGTISGNNNADTTNQWPTTIGYKTYGSSSDLWGLTWAPSDINASNFGVALKTASGGTSEGGNTASIDAVRITITYTPPPATRSPSGGAAYASPMFY